MLEAIKSIKAWQVAVLALATMAALGATYGGYLLLNGTDGAELSEDQQLIPVQRGDLVNEVSINGSLLFPNRDIMRFGVQGTVGQVLVEEGQQVGEGQPLVTLDEETVTGLEKAVAQARVALRDAEDTLTVLKSPAEPLELAQAEAGVANARVAHAAAQDSLTALVVPDPRELARLEVAVAASTVALRDARDALDALLESPGPEAVAKAESAVTAAKLSVQSARDALDSLLNPTAEDMARAESAVTDAARSLQDAEDALDRLLNPTSQQIAEAGAAVTRARLVVGNASSTLHALKQGPDDESSPGYSDIVSARTTLTDVRLALELARKEWGDKVEVAAGSADTSLDGYRAVFKRWLGAGLTDEELESDTASLLSSWGADLATLFAPATRFSDLRQLYSTTGLQDDPTTRWDEAVVFIWVNFFPGGIAITCDGGAVPFQGLCIEKEMNDSWDNLVRARDQLDTVEIQAEKAVAKAATAVANADERLVALTSPSGPLDIEAAEKDLELALLALQAAEEEMAELKQPPALLDVDALQIQVSLASARLAAAEADLAALEAGPDEVEVEAKSQQIALVEAGMETAQTDLATLMAGSDEVEIEAKRKQVSLAEADLAKAEADLTELTSGADPLDLDAAQKQVSVTLAKQEQAQEELEELSAGPDALEVSLREANVASAQASLDVALQRLDDATMRSPWEGIVSVVNVEAGDSVNPNTPVVEVVDPSVVEVDGIVDEIDVLFVRVGAAATVTMDALPDQQLGGTVSDVAVEATTQQGVVSYPMRIRVNLPAGMLIPEGLSAVASVVIREERDVLLLPLQTLQGTFDEPVVLVMQGGSVTE